MKQALVGMSGGVDSSVAAYLVKEAGYETTGATMRLFDNETIGLNSKTCCSLSSIEDACAVANRIGISYVVYDMRDDFRQEVIDRFVDAYEHGATPNPCVACKKYLKFDRLYDISAADLLDNESNGQSHVSGAEGDEPPLSIATGHYADTACIDDTWYVTKAANEKKDQSYMLYRLSEDVISRLILPLNEIDDKEKVRELARQKALKNSEAKDSQEICFIDENDNYKNFLERRGITAPKGNFVDSEGKVLGEHQGILNYTIGQRKGLGLALGKPAFVTCINCADNTVVLGDNADLFRTEVISSDNVIKGGDGPVTAKIRYAARPAEAEIEVMADGKIKTTFKEPQRAATPGQSIVFYRDNRVIGGGFIE